MRRTLLSSKTIATALAAAGAIIVGAASANAQTTLVLNQPGAQVTDTMVQAGASANTNFNKQDFVATRASTSSPDYLRHALLKFDTQNTMPAASRVTSAVLTLTIKKGNADLNRPIGVFPVTTSFLQEEATWNRRKVDTPWVILGGDLGPIALQQMVTNQAGAKVNFNVTALVQTAVSGATSSRYTRLALVDLGASTSNSYREYYSSEAVDPAVRPVLTVVYGGDAPVPTPPPSPSPPLVNGSTTTLRVLQYNTHHGGWGTDGVYNPDRIVAAIVKANPDVVSLQEIEINDSWSKGADQTVLYQTLLQNATGQTWHKVYMNRYGSTSGNGNLILSRYPFIATAGRLLPAGRSAVDATIDVNGRTINIASAHLDNVSSTNRLNEIKDLLNWTSTFAEQRIIVGDFNAWPGTTEIKTMEATYVDAWPLAQSMGTATGSSITHGSHRIDYVFVSKQATFLNLVGMQTYNTADANGIKPSDHEPVLAVFEVR